MKKYEEQYKEREVFVELAKKYKADHRLHSIAEEKLTSFLTRLYPDDGAVPEVSGVLGGRNDLMQFTFNGRRAVFEMFFSPNQVPQDLRLLEQANADIKVAILLDRDIDPKLADEFFHKKPDHFPFLWLSHLMIPSQEELCLAELRELIDESASINILRRILSSPGGTRHEKSLRKKLEHIETVMKGQKVDSTKSRELTGGELIVLQIIAKISKMNIPLERLRSLDAWMQNNIEFAFTLVVCGLQAFLITDLNGNHAIWSDGDFADDLILGAEDDGKAYIVICLNKTINDLLIANGVEKQSLRQHFVHSYSELSPFA